MKKVTAVFFATLIISAIGLNAETKYQVTPYVGYNFNDSDSELKDHLGVGISLDTFLNERYGIRLGFENWINAKYKGYPTSTGMKDTDVYRYYVNGVVNASDAFLTYFDMAPYLFGGIGYEDVDKACIGEESQGFTNVGLGIRFPVNEDISIVSEAKAIQKWKSKDVDVVGNIGVGYSFGQYSAKPVVSSAPKVTVEPEQKKEERIIIYNQFPDSYPNPVTVQSQGECPYGKNIPKAKNICDNRNYIQVAAKIKCLPDEQYNNRRFLNKIRQKGYHYIIYNTTNRNGTKVSKVLIGPFRCFADAKSNLCKVKRTIARDAFVYRK